MQCLLLPLLAVVVGGDVGCGEPTTTQKACKSIHCSRMVTSSQGIGYCVRGLPLKSQCMTDSDCHQAKCRTPDDEMCAGHDNCACSPPLKTYKDTKSGCLAALGAAVVFGCMFVPLHRKVDPANVDIATQFLLCAGAWLTGIAFALGRPGTVIHPLAVMGGGLFSFANILSPLIVKLVGPSTGMAVWSTTSLLSGWSVSYWGLFGLAEARGTIEEIPSVISVVLCVVGVVFYSRVAVVDPKAVQRQLEEDSLKEPYPTSLKQVRTEEEDEEDEELELSLEPEASPPPYEAEWVDKLGKGEKLFCGWVLAIVAGAAYGTYTVPALYIAENWDSLSKGNVVSFSPYGLDYMFSMASGILLGSSLHIFIAVTGGWRISIRGGIPSDLLFPSLFSGILWGVGHALVLYAATTISLAAVSPVVTGLTPAVASLWQAAVFRLSRAGSVKHLLAGILCSIFAAVITIASIHQ